MWNAVFKFLTCIKESFQQPQVVQTCIIKSPFLKDRGMKVLKDQLSNVIVANSISQERLQKYFPSQVQFQKLAIFPPRGRVYVPIGRHIFMDPLHF